MTLATLVKNKKGTDRVQLRKKEYYYNCREAGYIKPSCFKLDKGTKANKLTTVQKIDIELGKEDP